MFNIPNEKLKELLIKEGLIKQEDFDAKLKEAERMKRNIADVLISDGVVPIDYLERIVAEYLGVSEINLEEGNIDKNVLNLLPEDIARQKRVILFGREPDGVIKAAMEDPGDLVSIQFLERYLKSKIKTYFASEDDINMGFSLYGRSSAEHFGEIIKENVTASIQRRVQDKAKEEDAATEVPIVAIVDNLLSYAMSIRASDIHLEIFEDSILIRYRIDGVLHEILKIPKQVHPAIVARIKLLGGLKIDEHARPQDGRFRYKIGNDVVDLRVSIIPTFYGEKVVMRLLPATTRPLSFTELGMLDDTVNILTKNINRSYGMLLICGPTGSGKTTTLYSILGVLNHPEVNIVTVEDPIEYDIGYVNQTQINPVAGTTFANGLRAILRQDPNIIMVGEIRDDETAEIAVQSSLTGHLVLSSIHTNDASTAIPRLMDMHIEPFLISAVLNAVLAQRLVRKIHLDCIESYEPDKKTIDVIKEELNKLGFQENEIEDRIPKRLYRGKGCEADGYSGFEGRVGIFEALDITEGVRKLIANPNFTLDDLVKLARKEGMVTMFEDGLRKAEKGITSIEEVLRVIQE
jgi:type IV pilus assembly protein PilB